MKSELAYFRIAFEIYSKIQFEPQEDGKSNSQYLETPREWTYMQYRNIPGRKKEN